MTNELYHHGILGQKWGVRRYQNPDGTLKPAGKKRYSVNEKEENPLDAKKERHGLTENQKKALKVAGVVVATGLAAYGAYKVSDLAKESAGKIARERARSMAQTLGAKARQETYDLIKQLDKITDYDYSEEKIRSTPGAKELMSRISELNYKARDYDSLGSDFYSNLYATAATSDAKHIVSTLLGKFNTWTPAELYDMGLTPAFFESSKDYQKRHDDSLR